MRLVEGTKPSGSGIQKRRPADQEWWLQKLIIDGIAGGVYERTQSVNGRLSDWNARAVLVDKVENPTPLDEPRLTFSYIHVRETMPGSYMELASKVHDYLADPRHITFC